MLYFHLWESNSISRNEVGTKNWPALRYLISGAIFIVCLSGNITTVSATESAVSARLAVKSLLLDGDQKQGQMVVVGERGHILFSQDQGHNWQQAQVPSRALLTAVHLHDQQLGWAVGHDAIILKTEDGGQHWRQVFSALEEQAPLLDIWFSDQHNGIAIGAYGLMYVSEDGGEQWQQVWLNDEDDFHLNHINQTDDGTLFIAAEAGIIYRSTDEGASWQTLDSPYHGSFFGSLDVGKNIFLYGLRGHLLLSQDQGDSWINIDTGTTAMLTSAIKVDNRCIFSGLGGVLLIDEACDGKALTLQQRPSREGISDLLISDHGEVVLIGDHGVTRYKP